MRILAALLLAVAGCGRAHDPGRGDDALVSDVRQVMRADTAVVLGAVLVVAIFAACVRAVDVPHGTPPLGFGLERPVSDFLEPGTGTMSVSGSVAHVSSDSLARAEAHAILEQIGDQLPREPIAMIEVDPYGNILVPVQADAIITHDGGPSGPMIAGADIRGSRCARSVDAAMSRTGGPFTVICLPREYGLFERMNGRPAPGAAPEE